MIVLFTSTASAKQGARGSALGPHQIIGRTGDPDGGEGCGRRGSGKAFERFAAGAGLSQGFGQRVKPTFH
jgi:hypothetical protein